MKAWCGNDKGKLETLTKSQWWNGSEQGRMVQNEAGEISRGQLTQGWRAMVSMLYFILLVTRNHEKVLI